MKNKFICVFVTILAFYQLTFSQSDSAKILAEKIKTEGRQAILNAGTSQDKTIIPYLKTLALKDDYSAIQMALAKLGETEYLNQIILETESPNISDQNFAIRKLAYVANKKAYTKLYSLLDNTKERENDKRHISKSDCGLCCDVMVFSIASEVVRVLSKTIPNPPVKSYFGTDEDIELWKKWFEEHKELIE